MSSPRRLHEESIHLVDRSRIAKRRGDAEESERLLREALQLEVQAADLLYERLDCEPTRSVLYRSAGWLAIQLNDCRYAEILACKGLAGEPPEAIRKELRELLEHANFGNHLHDNGTSLPEDGFELAISGQGVGLGFVDVDDLIPRLRGVEKLIEKTADRLQGKSFSEGSSREKHDYSVHIGVPKAASFAFTVYVGNPRSKQLAFQFDNKPPADLVVNDLLDSLHLWQSRDEVQLRRKIKSEAYLNSFLHLAHDLAPDGQRVTGVHFRAFGNQGSCVRDFHLIQRIPPDYFHGSRIPFLRDTRKSLHGSRDTREGVLLTASAPRGRLTIKDDNDELIELELKDGLAELVRQQFGRRVRVSGVWKVRGRSRRIVVDSATKVD